MRTALPPTGAADRRWLRQAIVGLVMLPLSVLPFVAYFKFTPEGRLLWERFQVSVFKPHLPRLSPAEVRWDRANAPSYRGAVALLVYHGIGAGADDTGQFSIAPSTFAEQLATLRAAGMHAVTARDVADALAGRRSLPPKALMISFDDGRSDAMMYADPLLEQAGMRATMFVIAHAADDPGIYYVGWNDLETYGASGRWDMESHSANSHYLQDVGRGPPLPRLTSLAPNETISEYRSRVDRDLRKASNVLARHFGRRPVAFAYPFGAHGTERVNDPRIESILRHAVAANYEVAFDQDEQPSVPLGTCWEDPYSLRRLEVGEWSGRGLLRRISLALPRTRFRCRPRSPRGGGR